MKRIGAGILAMLLAASVLAGCAAKPQESSAVETTPSAAETSAEQTEESKEAVIEPNAEPVDVRVSAMKGPTAMGMVELMDLVDRGEVSSNRYHFELLSAVDEIAPKIAKGEVDIAAVPANLASVLYNNTEGQVQTLAINTLGVLYICETGDAVHSVADLKGKTLYASGKGATPEYALRYILEKNGVNADTDLRIEWKSEHAECVAALASDPEGIALLPQPFVTAAQAKNDKIRVALDLNEAWNAIQNKDDASRLLTGVVIVRKQFAEQNPQAVKDFLEKYKVSVAYTNANVDAAAALCGSYDIIAEPVAKKAIPLCNIVYIDGSEMKASLAGYLGVLFQQNPKSVGGKLPADDFYYGAE
ncbi:MAG: ABC transporter substrate-binding protein [Oribacterium sp.]